VGGNPPPLLGVGLKVLVHEAVPEVFEEAPHHLRGPFLEILGQVPDGLADELQVLVDGALVQGRLEERLTSHPGERLDLVDGEGDVP
jgi:hypothetical protein